MFDNIRLIIGFTLLIGLAANFFYRGIRMLIQLHKRSLSKEAVHTFQCRACEETYQLNGEEAQERISIWSTKLNTRTPTSQTAAVHFECPHCHTKAFQNRVFDTDATFALGNIRAQFDDSSKDMLLDFLVKGVAPTFTIMPLLSFIFP